MNAEDFLKAAIDPNRWLQKSIALRRSADRLWETFFEAGLRWAEQRSDPEEQIAEDAWDEASGHLTCSKLLYGLALETAFKAWILRESPESIELRMSADGTGAIREVEVKQFGVSLGVGHNLEKLGELPGLFSRGTDALFKAESDDRAIREILKHLTEVVLWSGRYPVPTRSGPRHMVPPDVPAVVFGHYIRDWADQILDKYQAPLWQPRSPDSVARLMDVVDRYRRTRASP